MKYYERYVDKNKCEKSYFNAGNLFNSRKVMGFKS